MNTIKAMAVDRKLVRLALAPTDHAVVRIAAARVGLSMAEFARRAVIAAAMKSEEKR